jgi:hypothetical protein
MAVVGLGILRSREGAIVRSRSVVASPVIVGARGTLGKGKKVYHRFMNATPLLTSLLAALAEARLEVVLIGNAAAALHGAPVTTIDFDFMFRDTPTNLRKLKTVAHALAAVVLRPYYPVSKLYRMVNDDTGLQADFMPVIHGVRSFEGLRRRAATAVVGGQSVLVAALDDIIKSKKAAGRERDRAVIPILEQTLRATRKR